MVQVSGDLAKLVSPKHVIDILHLLYVGKQVPVVHCQVDGYVSGALPLWEWGGGFLVLVLQRGLRVLGNLKKLAKFIVIDLQCASIPLFGIFAKSKNYPPRFFSSNFFQGVST